jgi:hypothetical protein
MEALKERQLTLRASRRPVEYNYTNADIHHANTNSHDGYQFEYPVNWAGDPSKNKVIGIRRINYKPTSVNIAVRFDVHNTGSDKIECNVVEVFTDQNSFEECITRMSTVINDTLIKENSDIRCITNYDKEQGTFELNFDTGTEFKKFDIVFPMGTDISYDPDDPGDFNERAFYKKEFLKLFNQEITKENVDKLHKSTSVDELKFSNVWNRDTFYCHASFSDSPKQIIGINHDFWQTPSVFYEHSDNSNDFNIYFTTNTVNRILPRNGIMLIQLSYIFNYANSMLMYV